ncbi:uncharacterized protein C8R40DRAFT_586224 [Lentinula edodes]|uniref:uncharacterized protein n=1 Tax=Lentinula edodes TaxID=5353 RepID=UPI001E8CF0E0|nr:uncharacterized protein C8R40DRAFT_586224 [Lentinula edodes]KAH7879236.1 hypothetical protein C8R40DRAFT_586224 [Lentinula edodes]
MHIYFISFRTFSLISNTPIQPPISASQSNYCSRNGTNLDSVFSICLGLRGRCRPHNDSMCEPNSSTGVRALSHFCDLNETNTPSVAFPLVLFSTYLQLLIQSHPPWV